ncbi:nucleoside phosphorylase [Algoriphagus namhaensis]|uniref:Uridine phosphorylase n=1 Tax=Algoriphagus namhaensis TaxID=915353 RepID=A0ABV8AP56_9BACT
MTQIPESELILNADGSVYHLHLHPDQIGEIIFTVGDPERVPEVSKYFDRIDFKVAKREFITHTGWMGDRKVSAMSTGMGTDNVEIFMTELDALVNIDLKTRLIKPVHTSLQIVRLGTSGTIHADIPVGSFLASETAIGLDTLMQFYPDLECDQSIAQALRKTLDLKFDPYQAEGSKSLLNQLSSDFSRGLTLTAPGFYAPQGRKLRIPAAITQYLERLESFRFGEKRITNFEMETAGYYAMGELLGHEVLSLNAILANRATGEFDKKAEKTVDLMISAALKLLL